MLPFSSTSKKFEALRCPISRQHDLSKIDWQLHLHQTITHRRICADRGLHSDPSESRENTDNHWGDSPKPIGPWPWRCRAQICPGPVDGGLLDEDGSVLCRADRHFGRIAGPIRKNSKVAHSGSQRNAANTRAPTASQVNTGASDGTARERRGRPQRAGPNGSTIDEIPRQDGNSKG